MQFKEGAKVFTAEGDRVGTLDRVVLDPDTKRVSHLVVQKGSLFTDDKVVPLSLIGSAMHDRVTLREDAGDLEALPDFEESHYVPTNLNHQPVPGVAPGMRPVYWYPPVGAWWGLSAYADPAGLGYVVATERNIPDSAVALEEGAKVLSSDGKHVGNIERVFTDPQEDRVTHLVISDGLFLKEKKLIPTRWLSNVLEDEVYLSVNSDLIDSLPEYHLEE